jgi:hypothetical protein
MIMLESIMRRALFFVVLGSLLSCGITNDEAPEIQSSSLVDAQCTLEIEKLGLEDIQRQLKCVKQNFLLLDKMVKRDDPRNLGLNVFQNAVHKFFFRNATVLNKSLEFIFNINMMLLNDDKEQVSIDNINKLFNILAISIQDLVGARDILSQINMDTYPQLRDQLAYHLTNFSSHLLKYSDIQSYKATATQKEVNLNELIDDLSTLSVDTSHAKFFFLLKKIFVGGKEEILTQSELGQFLVKLPQLIMLNFDVFFHSPKSYQAKKDLFSFYLTNLRVLKGLIHPQDDAFVLFTEQDIIDGVEAIGGIDLEEIGINEEAFKSLRKLKLKVLGSKDAKTAEEREIISTEYSFKDINEIIKLSADYFQLNIYASSFYKLHRKTLLKNSKVLRLPFKETSPSLLSVETQQKWHKYYKNIAVKYRYYRAPELPLYYGSSIKRNLEGLREIARLQWPMSLVLKYYGHKIPRRKKVKYQASVKELENFMYDIRPVLEYLNLWTSAPETFFTNTTMLMDLFQNQSNGNTFINLGEGTEYLSLITNTIVITEKIEGELNLICSADGSSSLEDEVLIHTDCFRENFFDILLQKMKYKRFLPKLLLAVSEMDIVEQKELLKNIEIFARDTTDVSLPINNRDLILTLGAMFNIESVLIRFDKNHTNRLELKELDAAFLIFKDTIREKTDELKDKSDSVIRSAFLFMVKNKRKPTPMELRWFHIMTPEGSIVATRSEIAALLSYFVLGSN